MKRLALLRHAKSDWADAGRPDFDRPLNARGRSAAQAVGRAMQGDELVFDLILASPAARSIETLDEVARAYGPARQRRLDPDIYLASAAALLETIRRVDDDVQRLLIVGHNPGLERLALLLSSGEGEERRRIGDRFPTGALVEMEFDVERWADVREEGGRIMRFRTPKDFGS